MCVDSGHILSFLFMLYYSCNQIKFMQELVSFRHPHVQNPRLQDDYENMCQMYLETPYDEMVAAHIGYTNYNICSQEYTVEPPNKGHFGSGDFVFYLEVVLW